MNGGVCQDSADGKDYTCECLDGFSGVDCEIAGKLFRPMDVIPLTQNIHQYFDKITKFVSNSY